MKEFKNKAMILFGFVGPLLPLLGMLFQELLEMLFQELRGMLFPDYFQYHGDFFWIVRTMPALYIFALFFYGFPAMLTGIAYGYIATRNLLPSRYAYLVHPAVAAVLGGFFSACMTMVLAAMGLTDYGDFAGVGVYATMGAISAAVLALVMVIWQRRAEAKTRRPAPGSL